MTDATDPTASSLPCSFDEFKLYYESTERVTERRLAANRWNYSISVGILLAIAVIYSWAADSPDYFFVAGLVMLVLTAVACIFCVFWLRQVQDWKALNAAKFEVLNEMAQKVRFEGPSGLSVAESHRPFDKEWEILQKKDRLTKVRIMRLGRIEALNASGAELFMPRAFGALFGVIFAVTLIALLLSWPDIPHNIIPGDLDNRR